MKQPKPFLEGLKTRKKAKGYERRLNMSKIILENAVNFPKGVTIKDIDAEFERWVKEELDITFDGKRLPTFKLFSNQRINEYAQSWNQLDENGNLLMNFKAITRDNNPKHGENQGNYYNIPGNRDYPMFVVPTLQENGLEAFDIYSMKQPYAINLEYTVSLIANKFELLNEMNQKMNFLFKALNCYICPNGHYMPMELEDIADESEYSIDDRKYYSQTYKIKVMAYIINEEDFKVTHQPSRMVIRMLNDKYHKNSSKTKVTIEENPCDIPQPNTLTNKELVITVYFDVCDREVDFTIDTDMVLQTVEMENIDMFKLYINGEAETFENDVTKFYDGDKIHIEANYGGKNEQMKLILSGYDPNSLVEINPSNESSLDDEVAREEIEIK